MINIINQWLVVVVIIMLCNIMIIKSILQNYTSAEGSSNYKNNYKFYFFFIKYSGK